MTHRRRHGYLTGPLVIEKDHQRIDLRASVWSGPTGTPANPISIVAHDAKFILLVEKQHTFDRLIEHGFHRTNPCVLASGGGCPGRSFHAVLRHLHDALNIPFYVLTDGDPAGYVLFFLIARGTARRNAIPNAALAIPDARFLGLRAGDCERLKIPECVYMCLNDEEIEKLEHLEASPWLREGQAWRREFDEMRAHGFKVELEALIAFSKSYLAQSYLPERLAAGDYLRLPS